VLDDTSAPSTTGRSPQPHTIISTSLEDRALLARFTAGDEESLAVVYERHRPALRRQAARLLYASGHDSDDVLQDVFLRVHTALRGGVVPLEPRAWLLRLVHNACVDELRRARTRPVGDIELDGMPALAAQLPDELARRAEARALLGDIHRLPDRQRSVLVMSAIDGLSHEEVAGRLDTTVETTRSLLARARENLRRTAAARETACTAVCAALDEAAAAGVRASEVARRHLWSCSDCRAHQRDLRTTTPSRLRRLAGWSPWGIVAQLLGGGGLAGVQKVAVGACCALVVGGGAVAVPELAVHARHGQDVASLQPEIVIQEAVKGVRAPAAKRPAPTPAASGPSWSPTPAATAIESVAVSRPKAAKRKPPARVARAQASSLSRSEMTRLGFAYRMLNQRNPTRAERAEVDRLLREFRKLPKGSQARSAALMRLQHAAFGGPRPVLTPAPTPPAKGISTPVPTPSATPAAPAATPIATATPVPTAAAVETPVPTATPAATGTATAVPVE
jgi:RNA polymerase sigma factor (sigma-70 family)